MENGEWRMVRVVEWVCARVCVFALLLWFDVFLCSDLCYKTKSSNYAKFIAKLHISTDFSKPFNSIQFILNKWNDLKLLCCNAKRFYCRKIVGRSTLVLNGVCEFEPSKWWDDSYLLFGCVSQLINPHKIHESQGTHKGTKWIFPIQWTILTRFSVFIESTKKAWHTNVKWDGGEMQQLK